MSARVGVEGNVTEDEVLVIGELQRAMLQYTEL